MSYVAVEFDNGVNNTHVIGYLRIPTGFVPSWFTGFHQYLKDTYNVTGDINIYPLRVNMASDKVGLDLTGYINMEDDFNLALRSNKYYCECDPNTDAMRRQWAQLDPMSPDFTMKER